MVHLGRLRAEQEELVVADAGDGELADDPAVRVEHRRERDAPDLRQAVGEQPLQPLGGAVAGDPVLGEVGALGQPDPLADGAALLGDDGEGVRPAERHVLDRLLPGRWNHSGCSSPKPAPQTALCSVSRSYTGVVCSGRAAGSSSLGNVMRKRRL